MTGPASDEFSVQVKVRPIFVKLLAGAFALGVAWQVLKAEVDGMVPTVVFTRHVTFEDSLKMEILRRLKDADDRGLRLERYLCRRAPSDMGC